MPNPENLIPLCIALGVALALGCGDPAKRAAEAGDFEQVVKLISAEMIEKGIEDRFPSASGTCLGGQRWPEDPYQFADCVADELDVEAWRYLGAEFAREARADRDRDWGYSSWWCAQKDDAIEQGDCYADYRCEHPVDRLEDDRTGAVTFAQRAFGLSGQLQIIFHLVEDLGAPAAPAIDRLFDVADAEKSSSGGTSGGVTLCADFFGERF